jgi:adenylate cyclase, class 2
LLEQEIKLSFDDIEAARQAVNAAGGRLVASRRLITDRLFDTTDSRLMREGATLRVRRDGDGGFLTFKGPLQPGRVKSREELETAVGDAATVETVLTSTGFRAVFRSEKYREEYTVDEVKLTVDEVPFGVFVEIEGAPDAIDRMTERLGRTPSDHLLDSYPALWRRWCAAQGLAWGDMVFDARSSRP